MSQDNILGLSETSLLAVRPEDIVVVKVNRERLTNVRENLGEIGTEIKKVLPWNKVLVLPDDVRVEVIPGNADIIVAG